MTVLAIVGSAWWLARPTRRAAIAYRGHTLRLELPSWSVRLGGGEGTASYLCWGTPRLDTALVTPGDAPDFRHVEQMGAAHHYMADGLRLLAVTRKQASLFTRIDLTLESAVEPAAARDERDEPAAERDEPAAPQRP